MKEQLARRDYYPYETGISLIEEPMLELARQLRGRFESGFYQLIVGDGLKGRFPTLVIGEFASRVANKNNIKPPIVSQLIMKRDDPRVIKNRIDELKEIIETGNIKTALIVTEFIYSGDTINNLGMLLRSLGIVSTNTATLDASVSRESNDWFFIGYNPQNDPGIQKRFGSRAALERLLDLKRVQLEDGSWRVVENRNEVSIAALRDADKLVDRMLSV